MDDCHTPRLPQRSLPNRANRLFGRFARETHAGPIVEFAIIVPVLLLLLLGTIDLGFAFFRMNSLVAAVREGARFAAVQDEPCLGDVTAIKTRVMNYFNPGVNRVADQLTTAKISVAALNSANAVISAAGCPNVTTISVRVPAYTYTPINPAFRLINGSGAFTFDTVRAVFRWERSP